MVRPLSQGKQQDVLSLLQKGCSVREIAKSLHVGKSSVQRLCKKHFPYAKLSVGGRPRKLTSAMERSCVTSITRGKVSTAREATKLVQEVFGVQVSEVTVRRGLCRAGLQSHVKEKKPHLSSSNIRARLEFARKYQHWTIDDWSHVIFSDETKINRFSSDGRVWCWVRDPQELSERTVIPTVKHGGGSVMIWGCMCIHGPGMMCRIEGRLNQHGYQKILEEHLYGTIQKYNLDASKVIFQQDNAPVHSSNSMKQWFSRQPFGVLSWPAQSPDLNPIENLWAILKRRLNRYDTPPKGILELWSRVEETFPSITVDDCKRLIESMPRRIAAVLKSKGKWTKW